ncbi:MAG: GNAT family N-acetyltransferase [Lachnospiraceae bacterium]|nr:GNAT family N-acetyltransferase [Lachnospiraceae bacterium]
MNNSNKIINLINIEKYDIFNANAYDRCLELYNLCKTYNTHIPSLFTSDDFCFVTDRPFIYIAKYKTTVVGCAMLCMYGDESERDLCIYVHPKYRRKKIATALLDVIYQDYDTICLVSNISPKNVEAMAFVFENDFEYESCEYKMSLDLTKMTNRFSDSLDKSNLSIDKIIEIDDICYLLKDGNDRIGSLNIFTEAETCVIHDVYIYEQYRNNGYATYLVEHVTDELKNRYSKVILHVTKENTPAFRLYKKMGFVVDDEVNIYVL